MSHATLWLEQLSVQQDLFWFTTLLAWGLAVVVWWHHPQRNTAWCWLPWAAGVGILGATVQFGVYNPPFRFLLQWSVPGPVTTYVNPVIAPELLGDLLTGALLAVMAAAWLWLATDGRSPPRTRWLLPFAAPLLAWLHRSQPAAAMVLVSGLMLLCVPVLWRTPSSDGLSRTALLLAALMPVLSPVSPLAGMLGCLMRDGPPNLLGLWSAIFQTLAGGLALAGLVREIIPDAAGGGWRVRWRDDFPLLLAAALWLVGGLAFALKQGADTRRDNLENTLRAVSQRANAWGSNNALGALGPGRLQLKEIEPPAGERPGRAVVPALAGPLGRMLRAELDRQSVQIPFLQSSRFLLLHEGWLVAVQPDRNQPDSGVVELVRRATGRDRDDWEHRRTYYEAAPVPEINALYSARAPIVDQSGRMIAWLEFVRAEFYRTVERYTRAVPLFVTAMGLVVIATLALQRRAAHGREVAAESSRVKTAFLAKVSHELRTPVQSLLGYGELLRGRLDGDAQAGAWLDAIQQHGTLLIRLVNDLIDLSAVEAGTFRLTPRRLGPAGLVRETVETLRPAADAKRLALRCDIGPGVPPWVEADGERLRQLVLNLAGNAVKFTDHGTVAVALDAAPAEPGRVRLTLTVRDTGPGIPATEKSRLFTAFSRLESTAHKEGSGLGLALCRALCHAMHGTLAVADNAPVGSCFTATLTVPTAESAAATVTPIAPAPVLQGCRVLVVDDNRLVRELFATALSARGARCSTAASLADAASAIRRAGFEAVVLDLALPDGNGASLVPHLRRASPGLRIVGVSAHAGAGEREQALAAGMDAFLTKPVALGELAATLAGRAPAPDEDHELKSDLFGQLEVEFRREAPVRRAELAAAVAAGEWHRAKATAHYLANSASVVRDHALLEACITLVRASTTADRPVIHASWSRCEDLLGRWLEPPVPNTA